LVQLVVRMYCLDIGRDTCAKLSHVTEKIANLLGPAVADESWGLFRPGLLTIRVAGRVALLWRTKFIPPTTPDPPIIRRQWVIFDYLFSTNTHVDPLFSLLSKMGMVGFSHHINWNRALPKACLVIAGVNVENGIMIFLHNGKVGFVENDLDNLAYVLGHILKSRGVYRVVLEDENCMGEVACNLSKLEDRGWSCVTWKTGKGKSIPKEARKGWSKEDYERKLKGVDWRRLEFEKENFGSIALSVSEHALEKEKTIIVSISGAVFKNAQHRIDFLTDVFDVLSSAVVSKKVKAIERNMEDRAEILRTYTERRGIIASMFVVKKLYGVEPRDVSYDFVGYDLDAGINKIEVKTFSGSIDEYVRFTITKNEYEKMKSVEGYRIFVVENAWSEHPQVNVINDPSGLIFKEGRGDRPKKVVTKEFEECFTCSNWKDNVDAVESGKVCHS
jgi:hypothetical protein